MQSLLSTKKDTSFGGIKDKMSCFVEAVGSETKDWEASIAGDARELSVQKKRRLLSDPKSDDPRSPSAPPRHLFAVRERLAFFRGAWVDTLGASWEGACRQMNHHMTASTGVAMEYALVFFMAWSQRNTLFNPALQYARRLETAGIALVAATTLLLDDEESHIVFHRLVANNVVALDHNDRHSPYSTCEAYVLRFFAEMDFAFNQPFFMTGINYTPHHIVVKHIGEAVYTRKMKDRTFGTTVLDNIVKTYEHWGLEYLRADQLPENDDDAKRAIDLAGFQGFEELRAHV